MGRLYKRFLGPAAGLSVLGVPRYSFGFKGCSWLHAMIMTKMTIESFLQLTSVNKFISYCYSYCYDTVDEHGYENDDLSSMCLFCSMLLLVCLFALTYSLPNGS